MSKIGIGTSCGKVILVGEHSVVYGKPAIALPLKSRTTTVSISATNTPTSIKSDYYKGDLESAPRELEGIRVLIKYLINHLNLDDLNFYVSIESTIPSQRGMGSSAAVTLAIIRAFYDYCDRELEVTELRKLAMISESIHHNNPSGLDLETLLSNSAIYFTKGNGAVEIPMHIQGYLVVGDTGKSGVTSQAVELFASNLNKRPVMGVKLEQLSSLAEVVQLALQDGSVDYLASAMNKAHALLKAFEVSDPMLDKLVDAAIRSGAIGAKLTGSGLGGCMIALCRSISEAQTVAQALINAGAKDSFIINLEENYDTKS